MDCAICTRELPLKGRRHNVHGRRVCFACQVGFATRRYLAFAVDILLLSVAPFWIADAVCVATTTVADASRPPLHLDQLPRPYPLIVTLTLVLIFLLRDGFSGCSPGKWLTGLRVIRTDNKEPIGPNESFKRNLPLIVPLTWLFIPFQLWGGARGGDDFARTRVIWRRFGYATPFAPRTDTCAGCGYSLRGNQSGRCPDCGRLT